MDRSTYEIRLAQWTKIVEECSRRPSGMTVTAWTEEHGIGVKNYYYWQRKVRRAMAQLMQPQLPSCCSREASGICRNRMPAKSDPTGNPGDVQAGRRTSQGRCSHRHLELCI